jgi:flagellar M-ring protein FliF
MDKIKKFLGELKKIGSKTKIKFIIGAVAVVAFAVIVAIVLNNQPYVVMFTDISNDEATEILAKLQDSKIDYQYKDGNILVKEDVMDKTKAELVYEGYPTSGFTYDVYTKNSGLMTTDSDKRIYQLYDLQNRIGATIRLFDGVKDAKVTIALGEDDKYALTDEDVEKEASASATVVMKDGGSPTQEQALAIQRLLSRSIQGMTFQNVSVFDGNGIEISVDTSESTTASGTTAVELATLVENQIAKNVMNVLSPIYGEGNVRVSVKGSINMEQLITEKIEYSTPEKIDKNDKTGIIENETGSDESSNGDTTDGGVAGTDSNADVSKYNTQKEADANGNKANSYYKEYLVNQIKEQGTVNPGVLEDLSISVAINGKDYGVLEVADLQALIGNAAGIQQADREAKIAIASAPFYKAEVEMEKVVIESTIDMLKKHIIPIILGTIIFIVLIILLLKPKKKNRVKGKPVVQESPSVPILREGYNEDAINLQNEKGMELKQNIRDFSEKNPEISAQLLKNWLSGEGKDE